MALYIGNGKKVSVKVVKDGIGNIEGTAIPIGMNIDGVYTNIYQSKEKVDSILSQLTYVQTDLFDGASIYIPYLVGSDSSPTYVCGLVIINLGQNYAICSVRGDLTDMEHFNLSYLYVEWGWGTYIGSGYDIVAQVNRVVLEGGKVLSDFNGISIGLENEKIKNVLSITPFLSMSPYDCKVSMGVNECQS